MGITPNWSAYLLNLTASLVAVCLHELNACDQQVSLSLLVNRDPCGRLPLICNKSLIISPSSIFILLTERRQGINLVALDSSNKKEVLSMFRLLKRISLDVRARNYSIKAGVKQINFLPVGEGTSVSYKFLLECCLVDSIY